MPYPNINALVFEVSSRCLKTNARAATPVLMLWIRLTNIWQVSLVLCQMSPKAPPTCANLFTLWVISNPSCNHRGCLVFLGNLKLFPSLVQYSSLIHFRLNNFTGGCAAMQKIKLIPLKIAYPRLKSVQVWLYTLFSNSWRVWTGFGHDETKWPMFWSEYESMKRFMI